MCNQNFKKKKHFSWEIPQITLTDDRQSKAIINEWVNVCEWILQYLNSGMDVVASEKCQKQG